MPLVYYIYLFILSCTNQKSKIDILKKSTGNDNLKYYMDDEEDEAHKFEETFTECNNKNNIKDFIDFIYSSQYFSLKNTNLKKIHSHFFKNTFIFDDPKNLIFYMLLNSKHQHCKYLSYHSHFTKRKNHEKIILNFHDPLYKSHLSKKDNKGFYFYEKTFNNKTAVLAKFSITVKSKTSTYTKFYTLLKIYPRCPSSLEIKKMLKTYTFNRRHPEERHMFLHKEHHGAKIKQSCLSLHISNFNKMNKSKIHFTNHSCMFYDEYIQHRNVIFIPYPLSEHLKRDFCNK